MSKLAERANAAHATPGGSASAGSGAPGDFPRLPLNVARRPLQAGMTPYPALVTGPDPNLHAKARHFAKAWMQRLRAWRVEQALTREALAELSGLPVSAIKRAERDGAISLPRFLALALSLGLESELGVQFMHRRLDVPAIVLHSRMRRRQRGWRQTRERLTPRGRA